MKKYNEMVFEVAAEIAPLMGMNGEQKWDSGFISGMAVMLSKTYGVGVGMAKEDLKHAISHAK